MEILTQGLPMIPSGDAVGAGIKEPVVGGVPQAMKQPTEKFLQYLGKGSNRFIRHLLKVTLMTLGQDPGLVREPGGKRAKGQKAVVFADNSLP